MVVESTYVGPSYGSGGSSDVEGRVDTLENELDAHTSNGSNPHGVDDSQTGAASALSSHTSDESNPHGVDHNQTGAASVYLPTDGSGVMSGSLNMDGNPVVEPTAIKSSNGNDIAISTSGTVSLENPDALPPVYLQTDTQNGVVEIWNTADFLSGIQGLGSAGPGTYGQIRFTNARIWENSDGELVARDTDGNDTVIS